MRAFLRSFFDVREGEFLRTLLMALYLLLVLFAYYIVKPLSRSLFLNKFDIDRLPYLYILIAGAGGILAYLYTKLAIRFSLQTAVAVSMAFSVACLAALAWLISLNQSWILYAFNIWVSLFSVVLVSQGWLVAANVFNSREAKRLYGLLGMGAVVGAGFGGTFIAQTAKWLGPRNQLLASAMLVILAYGAFRLLLLQKGVALGSVRGAEAESEEFQFRDIFVAIGRQKHLQVIIGIITLTFIVDVTIEYQFNAMAKLSYQGAELTAFLGNFYGVYLNLITFGLQFFLTGIVVNRLGVGGTLQIMPVTLSLTALVTFLLPGIYSSAGLRLTEAATRYTLNRTGMELLYLPLPAELRNRTKAFIDIFVDRVGRGLGGMILILCTSFLLLKPTQIALVTVGFSLAWMALSARASREYLATVRRRLASRRLDFESARISVGDRRTLALIEQTATSKNPRQAAYALSLLAEASGYDIQPLLSKLASSPLSEVRAKVYDLARSAGHKQLVAMAQTEIQRSEAAEISVQQSAAAYLVAVSLEPEQLAAEFLGNSNVTLGHGALDALAARASVGANAATLDWLREAAAHTDPRRRALAARAVRFAGEPGEETLEHLLRDSDPQVVAAACAAAGALRNRAAVYHLTRCLTNTRVRGAALAALADYGPGICGTLSDLLEDDAAPAALRRQIPRVLKNVKDQRSVDILIRELRLRDPEMRRAILKALNRLRESAPNLRYTDPSITEQIQAEARRYCELNALLEPFRAHQNAAGAAHLLARTLEERMHRSLELLFRLLGLRYPQQEIYSVYLALNRRHGERSSALEFLDGVLERDLKRIVVPLLDAPERVLETGRRLFGIGQKSAESAIRDLLQSGDSWLMACAAASAAELKLQNLARDIATAAQTAGAEVAEVARSAAIALA